jgi:glycosyltransferase involved in cell wall biosynthesis
MFSGLSIVIPYYGDRTFPNVIRGVVESRSRLSPPQQARIEVLVVDDCSPIPLAAPAVDLPLKVFRQHPNRGVGAARNRGAGEARLSHILFLDADVVIDPTFLPYVFDYLASKPATTLIQGPYAEVPANDNPSLFHHYLAISWIRNSTSTARGGVGTMLVSGCCIFSREFFNRIGGFIDVYGASGGEEFEIASRIPGGTMIQDLNLRNYHYSDDLLPRMRKLLRRARWFADTIRKNPNIPLSFKLHSAVKALCAVAMTACVPLVVFSPLNAAMTYLALYVAAVLVDLPATLFMARRQSITLALVSVFFRQVEYSIMSFGLFLGAIEMRTHVQRAEVPLQ